MTLDAAFQCTLGFYLWRTLKQLQISDLTAVANTWQSSIQEQCQRLRQRFSNEQPVSDVSKIVEALFRPVLVADPSLVLLEPLQPEPTSPSAPSPHDLLHQFLNQLVLSAKPYLHAPGSQTPTPSNPMTATAADEASDVQTLADCSERDASHTDVLHGLLVLLSIACQVACVPASVSCKPAVEAMLQACYGLCNQLKEYAPALEEDMATLHLSDPTNQDPLAAQDEQIKIPTLMIVDRVMDTLQSVVTRGGEPGDLFLTVMRSLIANSRQPVRQAVVSTIIGRGGYIYADT